MGSHLAVSYSPLASSKELRAAARSGMQGALTFMKMIRAFSGGAAALGAVATGALAFGAVAIWAIGIRRLAAQDVALSNVRIRRLIVDELVVHQSSRPESIAASEG